jgi:hypothetical protein
LGNAGDDLSIQSSILIKKQQNQIALTKSKQEQTTDKGIIRQNSMNSSSTQPQCRICWGSEEVDDNGAFNPLISPCNCTGTISSIHLKCLKGWLETKRTMKIHKG